MPAIFSEQQRKKLRKQLLDTGFDLLKQSGYRKMTVSDLTKKCGIAKGTFYNFFNGKEDFTYELMLYLRDLEKKRLLNHVSADGHLSQNAFKEYIHELIHDNTNIFSYMSQEEITLLTSAWPDEYLLNSANDEKTILWILDMIPDKSPNCDWKIFLNYMKGLAIVTVYKHLLNQESADTYIEQVIDDMAAYVWGR